MGRSTAIVSMAAVNDLVMGISVAKFFRKIKFRDKEDNWLIIGAIISFCLIFWFQFFAYDMKEIITRGQEWSDLIVNISMSYIAGWIIYIVSIYIPKIDNQRKAKKIVYPFLKNIIVCIDVSLNNSILYPNEKCRPVPNASELSNEDIKRWLNDDFLNQPIKGIMGVFDQYGKKPKTRLEEFIISTTYVLDDSLNELKNFQSLLSYDEVELLTDIEKSRYLLFVGKNLKIRDKYLFDIDMFVELYQLIRALDKHITRRFN